LINKQSMLPPCGNYKDNQGYPVYRQSGLGKEGLIFKLKEESVYVYWDTSELE